MLPSRQPREPDTHERRLPLPPVGSRRADLDWQDGVAQIDKVIGASREDSRKLTALFSRDDRISFALNPEKPHFCEGAWGIVGVRR